MIDKNLAFMTDARTAGVVMGARVPIVLTSRGRGSRRAPFGQRPSRDRRVTSNGQCMKFGTCGPPVGNLTG
jgi:hypothetical protein